MGKFKRNLHGNRNLTSSRTPGKKPIKQVEEHKEEIKAFIENVTKHDDYDIILTGAGTSEIRWKRHLHICEQENKL